MEDRGEELDLLLVALGQLARHGGSRSRALEAASARPAPRRARRLDGQPWRRAKKTSWSRTVIFGYEAAFLGQVAPRRPRQPAMVDPVPGDRAGVGSKHPEGDPHRRGLARAVGAEEAEDVAGRDLQGQVVEGLNAAEPLGQAGRSRGTCRCQGRHAAPSIPAVLDGAIRGRSCPLVR